MIRFAVIIPVYNAVEILPVLVDRLKLAMRKVSNDFLIVLIDDGSTDDSWNTIKNLKVANSEIFGIKLQINYGQHQAIRAGIETVQSENYIVMDCDLQDNPDVIPDFVLAANHNKSEVVIADRKTKKGRLYYKLSSIIINTILSGILFKHINYRTGNFGLYSTSVIERIKKLPLNNFYFPVAVRKVSNVISEIQVQHEMRYAGKSNYTFKKHLSLAIAAIRFAASRKNESGNRTYNISEIAE